MSDFAGELASTKVMSWEQFVSAKSRADVADRVGLGHGGGVPYPDQVVRLGLRRDRSGLRRVVLRVVPNDERILIFAPDGAVAWLERPPRARGLGYFVAAVDVSADAGALFLASFRAARRVSTAMPSTSDRVWLSNSQWVGLKDRETDRGGARARLQVELLGSLLRTGFELIEGGSDPRDVLLPSVSLSIESSVAAAEPAAAPVLVSAFASARMPAHVSTSTPFPVDVSFDGPEAPARQEWERILIKGLNPDQQVTVKVLSVRNVAVAEGYPDSIEFSVPAGKTSQLARFTMQPLAPGKVEVHLRFRQEGVTVGLLRLEGNAHDQAPDSPGRTNDRQPFQTQPPRDRVLEISFGASVDGELIGVEYDLVLDGETLSWSRSVAADEVLSYLYFAVEERWQEAQAAHPDSHQKRDAVFADHVRELGGALFREFLPVELQQLMRTDLDRFRGLMVITNEPRIPWEIACVDDAAGAPQGMLFAELGMVRGLSGVVPKSHIRINAARSKYLVPDYRERLPELSSALAERTFLADSLRATPISPSSVTSVKSLLAKRDYDLFHFAGHGATSESDKDRQVILLMGARGGNPVPFGPDDLEAAVRKSRALPEDSGRIVVLNACHSGALWSETSGFAVAFLRGGADLFIGSQWSVADTSAAFFASALYLALLAGAPLHQAAATARRAAKEEGGPGWVAYAVYGDPDAAVEFDRLPVG